MEVVKTIKEKKGAYILHHLTINSLNMSILQLSAFFHKILTGPIIHLQNKWMPNSIRCNKGTDEPEYRILIRSLYIFVQWNWTILMHTMNNWACKNIPGIWCESASSEMRSSRRAPYSRQKSVYGNIYGYVYTSGLELNEIVKTRAARIHHNMLYSYMQLLHWPNTVDWC